MFKADIAETRVDAETKPTDELMQIPCPFRKRIDAASENIRRVDAAPNATG